MKLELDRISKQYGNKIALDGISLELQEGIYGLLGANGAGKTTLMRIICGILNPTAGEVKLNGTNNIEMGEDYRDILGYLPQDFGYYPSFKAKEFMLYMASLKGLESNYAKMRTEELLQIVGLSEVANKKVGTFSGGMKQRLGIAQAVLNDPKVLILDEPTAGLDPKERIHFRKLISSFAEDKIIILSTHIVSDVEQIADQILILKKGNLLTQGTVMELTDRVRGKVWECVIDNSELEQFSNKYSIVNQHIQNNQMIIRVVGDDEPDIKNKKVVAPTLEDLYMYYFHENEGRM